MFYLKKATLTLVFASFTFAGINPSIKPIPFNAVTSAISNKFAQINTVTQAINNRLSQIMTRTTQSTISYLSGITTVAGAAINSLLASQGIINTTLKIGGALALTKILHVQSPHLVRLNGLDEKNYILDTIKTGVCIYVLNKKFPKILSLTAIGTLGFITVKYAQNVYTRFKHVLLQRQAQIEEQKQRQRYLARQGQERAVRAQNAQHRILEQMEAERARFAAQHRHDVAGADAANRPAAQECAICRNAEEHPTGFVTLPTCHHTFGRECLNAHFQANPLENRCPTCRNPNARHDFERIDRPPVIAPEIPELPILPAEFAGVEAENNYLRILLRRLELRPIRTP